MKALRLMGNRACGMVQVPDPHFDETSAIVKVTAAGICGSDIEMLYNAPQPPPHISGHEISGVVVAAGSRCGIAVGERVMVNCHVCCGECEQCRRGDSIFCVHLSVIGFDHDGGHAQYVLVPRGSLRRLPDDISDEMGVLIGDALGTAYSAVKKACLSEGMTAAVFGAGPIGLLAVTCAHKRGARVIAVDADRDRLDQAREFGAAECIDASKSSVGESLKNCTGGIGVDKVIQCAPSPVATIQGLFGLRERGTLIQVGVSPPIHLHPFEHLCMRELTIAGTRNFNDHDLGPIIDFARANPHIAKAITHRFALEDAPRAFEAVYNREGGKVLICS
jgi:threonine dehydrogenase-like Zn-dependent dehydrogenase